MDRSVLLLRLDVPIPTGVMEGVAIHVVDILTVTFVDQPELHHMTTSLIPGFAFLDLYRFLLVLSLGFTMRFG